MRILVLNCGSSSIKLRLFQTSTSASSAENSLVELARGSVERIGNEGSSTQLQVTGDNATSGLDKQELAIADHAAGLDAISKQLVAAGLFDGASIDLVAHRVVHGGSRFSSATLLDDQVLAELAPLSRLAPLHNPANLSGIEVARKQLPNAKHVAVFDTAFHQTMPESAWRYALPRALADEHGLRRYGFHGMSHQWASHRTAELPQQPIEALRTVVLHLGAGASATAVAGGRSVDTSMGFTPLEGLVMATRPGDLDPGVLLYMQHELGWSAERIAQVLNKESGLVGLCGVSDFRDLCQQADTGHDEALLALELFVTRIVKQVGAYAALLGGLDMITFTAGIGENSPRLRKAVIERLALFGAAIDDAKNEATEPADRLLHTKDSAVGICVVAANEELQMAREALAAIDS